MPVSTRESVSSSARRVCLRNLIHFVFRPVFSYILFLCYAMKEVEFIGNDSRKKTQRKVALRRAEHFALSSSTPSGVAAGSVDTSQTIAGPFRIANEILSQGVNSKRSHVDPLDDVSLSCAPTDKYEEIVMSLEDSGRSTKHPRIERERLTGPIDTLQNLCVRKLVDLIHLVDDLEGVHPEDLERLATALGKARKLDNRAALLVAIPSTESLFLPECSMIQEDTLMTAIEQVRGGQVGEDVNATSPLRSLRLRNCGNSMSDKSALKLATIVESLQDLELSGCYKLGDEALGTLLSNCSNLKELNLSTNCRLGGRGILSIHAVSSLRCLALNNCVQLVDEDLLQLVNGDGPRLLELSLVGLTSVTDASICPLIDSYGALLTSLRLGGCVLLSDEVLSKVKEICSNLLHLDIGHLHNLSEAAILSLFIQKQEEESETSETMMVQDEENGDAEFVNEATRTSSQSVTLVSAYSHIGSLESINLVNVRNTTDEVIKFLSEACKGLRDVCIGGCKKLTDKAIICLCANAKHLLSLDISFVRGIRNQAMVYMVDSCSDLKTLHVWGCTQLDSFYSLHSNHDLLVVGRT